MITIDKNKINIIYIISISLILFTCTANKDKGSIKDVLQTFKGEPVVPREANRILIPEFINLKKIPGIAEKLTIKIREQITLDGRLAVVSDSAQAELMLRGILIDYQIQPIKYDGFDRPVKKRLRILASAELYDTVRNKEIFVERSVQAFEEYSEIIPPITSEIQVQDKVLDDMAKRVALLTIKGWYTKLMTPVEKGKK